MAHVQGNNQHITKDARSRGQQVSKALKLLSSYPSTTSVVSITKLYTSSCRSPFLLFSSPSLFPSIQFHTFFFPILTTQLPFSSLIHSIELAQRF
ncbi:hypothetical protein FRX31_023790 [Thalictrum thalictroides]|uniref:Uncharacterized protein n=1 Tax=Thalictrum thalictroides TaxID=46969 RepID=A0A7J6VNF8_THATH|nr:hypothetical protein FRX31_023790 [Thalictrum thalictroides]